MVGNHDLSIYPDFRSLGVILDLFRNYGYHNDPRYQSIYKGLLEDQQRLEDWYRAPVNPNGYHEAQIKMNIMNDVYSLVLSAPQIISNAWIQMIRSHSSVMRGGY